MIFLSHNSKDKPIVEPIAIKLASVFGYENVFYDSWSIQPGDGIIDKMNEGLGRCKFFFYFVSSNSLTSSMVRMEWQNALIKAAQSMIRFVPVRLDASSLPPIMLQTLYIDLFSNGIEVSVRQIVDVINGVNTFHEVPNSFSNLVAYKYIENEKLIIECRALQYLEPISIFSLMSFDDIDGVDVSVRNEIMHSSGKHKGIQINSIEKANFITVGISRGTLPGFPFIVELSSRDSKSFDVVSVLHKTSIENFTMIPLFLSRP